MRRIGLDVGGTGSGSLSINEFIAVAPQAKFVSHPYASSSSLVWDVGSGNPRMRASITSS